LASNKKVLRSKSRLSKTGILLSQARTKDKGQSDLGGFYIRSPAMPRGVTNSQYPPHLALMKVEIEAEGWFFLCSLVPRLRDWFFLQQWQKEQRKSRSCKLRVTLFETESLQTTPALRATPPKKRRGISDKRNLFR
jgi:hypothetical protein